MELRMKKTFSQLNLSVAEALQQYPDLLPLFLRYHTGCVGCMMASFCTLQSAEELHELEETNFLTDVQAVIDQQPG
jgi:hypothetical protein